MKENDAFVSNYGQECGCIPFLQELIAHSQYRLYVIFTKDTFPGVYEDSPKSG